LEDLISENPGRFWKILLGGAEGAAAPQANRRQAKTILSST
jgi:hypothetical protein